MSEDTVVLQHVTKVFESGSVIEEDLAAVQDLSLNIRQGEFFYFAWAERLREDDYLKNDCRL